tara:strand:- start:1052 stop:1246 length:195 start_codon:yes stop_codon:yes gene_type:complete
MDSFLHNHQAALDSQREEAAINWRFPEPDIEDIVEDEENFPAENDEPSDFEMMSSFGTVWHDWL